MKSLKDKKIVIIGGGTGQGRVAKSLKDVVGHISAIVTMADDGGSTGRLRRNYDVPAVGDIRNVLSQLADPKKLLTNLFPYRYGNDRWGLEAQDVEGHVLGNLILLALIDKTGSLPEAVKVAKAEMKISHDVIPSTLDNIVLCAKLGNGSTIKSQFKISHEIPRAKKFAIRKVWLERQPDGKLDIRAYPPALEAIKNADDIIIGPGALHGSILPNLVISEILKAVIQSKGKKIYIANTAIKLSETRGFSLEDHIKSIMDHTDRKIFDLIIVNNNIPKGINHSTEFLSTNKTELFGIPIVQADLIDKKDIFVHDPVKMKKVLSRLLV